MMTHTELLLIPDARTGIPALSDFPQGDLRTEARDGVACRHTTVKAGGRLRISTTLVNETSDTLHPADVDFLGTVRIRDGRRYFTHAYVECLAMLGQVGPRRLTDGCAYESYGMVGLTDENGQCALLLGMTRTDDHFYRFAVTTEGDDVLITPLCAREGIPLAPGGEVTLADLEAETGTRLSPLLSAYAERLAAGYPSRVQAGIKTGWCSWYHYYSTETEADILRNASELAASELRASLSVILLDDGWNLPDNTHPCVWGDWEAGGKFPEGMRAVADSIHARGFEAGLWLAPFAVAKDSRLLREHPEWIVGGAEGLINNNASVFGLDVTHPGAARFITDTFTRVFDVWGFDYVKTDFLQYAVVPGRRYDPTLTTAQVLRRGMELIRRAAGDRFVLGCGTPLLPLIGLCDGMRIGADVGSQWSFPLNHPYWPLGNCSIKPAVRYTVFRHWQHRVFWQNDPDCLVVRSRENGIEGRKFREWFGGVPEDGAFGLSDSEASLWAKVIWFTGGMWFLSEDWAALPPERRGLVRLCTHPNTHPVRVTDCWGNDDLMVMENTDADTCGTRQFALINIGDEPVQAALPAARYGLTAWRFRERFSGACFSGEGQTVTFPPLPGRTAVVYESVCGTETR